MRIALASAILFALVAPTATFAQQVNAAPIVNPFDEPQPQGGVSARIGDAPARRVTRAPLSDSQDSDSRFALRKLALPKLPKFEMPKLQMPKLPTMSRRESQPARPPRPTRAPREPSTWDKFNAGTKRFFTKTKDTLLPWTAGNAQANPQRPPTGTNRIASSRSRSGSNRARAQERTGIFSPFLPDKEPQENQVESTTDFLKLPRPY